MQRPALSFDGIPADALRNTTNAWVSSTQRMSALVWYVSNSTRSSAVDSSAENPLISKT